MTKNSIIILVVVLVGVGIFAFVMYVKSHTPKFKWEPDYLKKSEQPYGLKCFYDLLKTQNTNINSISTDAFYLLDTNETNGNLIIIDSYVGLDSLNSAYLLDYVYKGNKVFIATDEAPLELFKRFLPSTDSAVYDKYESSAITIKFTSSELPYPETMLFHHQYYKNDASTHWSGYFKNYFDTRISPYNIVPISYFNDTIINCFYATYGKGKLVVHTNPILFANYNIIQKNGFKNARNIFSYLNNGPVHWHEFQYPQYQNNGSYENNPLKFLFSHYTLRTGWYVLIASILIFILFRSKREQRIIPVIYKNKNTSIEYAKAIGSLYYQKKSHHYLGIELYTIFLSEIRTRYNIITSAKESDLIEQISKKAEVKKEILIDLFASFDDVRHDVNSTSKQLIKLYQAIGNFNKIKK